MSELMKSLAKSEQAYQSVHSVPSQLQSASRHKPNKLRLPLIISIMLVPSFAYIGYLGFSAHQFWDTQTKLAYVAQEEQKALPDISTTPSVTFLTYPELADIKSLSQIRLTLNVDDSVVATPDTEKMVSANNSADEFKIESLDLSELSPELAQRVQNALGDELGNDANQVNSIDKKEEIIELINNESRLKGKLPEMNLQTHMYASNAQRRWVKINGRELQEGDWLNESVQLLSITPRTIIIGFQEEAIEIPALYEWQG